MTGQDRERLYAGWQDAVRSNLGVKCQQTHALPVESKQNVIEHARIFRRKNNRQPI